MKRLLLMAVAATLLAACEERPKDAQNQYQQTDTLFRVRVKYDTIFVPKTESAKSPWANAYYLAKDFSLPKGTVLDFAPNDNDAAAKNFKDGLPVFIKIAEANGHIAVIDCNYKNWQVLEPNDVLK